MKELKQELKELIIEALELEDISPQDIENDTPLFGDGLGLDSIDALELGMQIQKKYNIKIDPKQEDTRAYFASINGLADFITQRATGV